MLDYDDIDAWAPELSKALASTVPASVIRLLSDTLPEFMEDSRALLFKHVPQSTVVDATLSWLGEHTVVAYHGSRLTESDVVSIRRDGLIPLSAEQRRDRLERAFSQHPDWETLRLAFEKAIADHGIGERAGRREGQVHLTLSREGLLHGFDHYLRYGAEFDQRVAHALLGEVGMGLLARDGAPTIIRVAIPGCTALSGAHPIFSIDALRDQGDVPNLVKEFLEAWCYRWSHPAFQTRSEGLDCGICFSETVPSDWIISIEDVEASGA